MTGAMMKRRFFPPLRGIFDDGVTDWFVGVDKVLDDMAARWDHAFASFHDFPSAEIEKIDDTHYRVALKVPGYGRDEITVQRIDDELVIKGEHKEQTEGGANNTSFEQHLYLARDLKVEEAKLDADEVRIIVSFPKEPQSAVEDIPLG